MNTHLKQLWAAMKLPKNFKKSYKFFCRGLDIRVTQIMETKMWQSKFFYRASEIMRNHIRVKIADFAGNRKFFNDFIWIFNITIRCTIFGN